MQGEPRARYKGLTRRSALVTWLTKLVKAVGGGGPRPVVELLRLLPRASRWGTFVLLVEVVGASLASLALMPVSGALVALIAGEPSPLPGVEDVWIALGVLASLLVVLQAALPFLSAATEHLGHRLDLVLSQRMLQAVMAPATLAHLEEPDLADELTLARTVGTDHVETPRVITALSVLGSARLVAVGSAVVLAGYRWWAPLLLFVAWMISNHWYRRETERLISSLEASTAGFRRGRYVSDLALDGSAAKELRIFGLAGWLAARFDALWRAGIEEVWRRGGQARAMLASGTALMVSHTVVLGLLARSAFVGDLGLGELTIFVQAALGLAAFGWDADNQYLLRLGAAPVPHAQRVVAEADGPRFRLPGSGSPPAVPQSSISFEAVSFAYPGTERAVLRGLDLELPAGRSLAIVGNNGSGKTTLLKLLCRFYDPTEGRVSVDGVDLREFDAPAWQRRVAAVFQDFPHYPLTAADNVTFGSLEHADDAEALQRAAAAAGVADFVSRFPAGWKTPLSRQFEGGTDPSGGQWQRLALARVLFAVEGGVRILVLDEPTANLDIRAEADFYERFLDLTRGLTTVLISHRFSTVRCADHIVVLDRGRIVEAGSHDELMALSGQYATMFNLQAEAYRPTRHA